MSIDMGKFRNIMICMNNQYQLYRARGGYSFVNEDIYISLNLIINIIIMKPNHIIIITIKPNHMKT